MDNTTQAFALLDTSVKFIKEHYAPFSTMKEVDIMNYLVTSWADGTFSFVIVQNEMIAFYEYWLITEEYLRRLEEGAEVGEFPTPTVEDRKGYIPFTPLAVIHQDFLGRGFGLTRIVLNKLANDHPEYRGVYRWVLNEGRLGYIPLRKEEKDGNRPNNGVDRNVGNRRHYRSVAGEQGS